MKFESSRPNSNTAGTVRRNGDSVGRDARVFRRRSVSIGLLRRRAQSRPGRHDRGALPVKSKVEGKAITIVSALVCMALGVLNLTRWVEAVLIFSLDIVSESVESDPASA